MLIGFDLGHSLMHHRIKLSAHRIYCRHIETREQISTLFVYKLDTLNQTFPLTPLLGMLEGAVEIVDD